MKPRILQIILLVTLFHFSKATLFTFSDSCKTIWGNSTDLLSLPECIEFLTGSSDDIIKHLNMLYTLYELQHPELVLIVADNMENGIKMARFLSKNNQKRPTKERKAFSNENLLIYDFILDNIHVYQNPITRTLFFVYPHQTKNDKLASFLVSEFVRHTIYVKILLTLSISSFPNDNQLRIKRLFDTTVKFIRNSKRYLHSSHLVLTDETSKDSGKGNHDTNSVRREFKELTKKYLSKSSSRENGKHLAEFFINNGDKLIIFDVYSNMNYNRVFIRLGKLRATVVNSGDFENSHALFSDCVFNFVNEGMTSVLHSFQAVVTKNLSQPGSSLLSLTGVLTLSNKLNTVYATLTSFFNCTIAEGLETLNNCFKNLSSQLQEAKMENLEGMMPAVNNYLGLFCSAYEWSISILPSVDSSFMTEQWISSLKKYTEMIKNNMDWYQKLVAVFHKVPDMSVGDISKTLKILEEKLRNSSDTFLNVNNMKIAHKTIESNSVKMEANFSCVRIANEVKLQVTGKFLRLDEILSSTRCQQKFRILELFALEKIIIDRDLIAGAEGLDVFIFAPVWEIVLNRKIDLEGVSKSRGVFMGQKAKNGNQIANRNGANGLAGLPGGSGGTYYGLANTIINAKNLQISVNGGNGSDGQDGGDAAAGADGESPSKNFIIDNLNRHYCSWSRNKHIIFKIKQTERELYYTSLVGPMIQLKYKRECYIFGLEGYPGGYGGQGGIKGKGGMAGDYKLISLDDSSQFLVTVSASNGADGKQGHGGKAGNGGFTRKVTFHNKDYFDYFIKENATDVRANDGRDGKDNSSSIGMKISKERIILQTYAQTANLYKRFILESVVNYNDSRHVDLYKQVIGNGEILKTYDTLTLVEEYIDLEQHYYKTSNKSETLFLYQSWKNRLDYYSANRKKNEASDEYSEILRRLEGTVSEKIKRLVRNSQGFLIFMLANYLVESQQQARHLQNAKTVVIIKNTNSKYTEEYGDKIEEAQRIIQEDLQSNLTKSNDEISGEMEMLLRQVSRMVGLQERNAEELVKKSMEVEHQAVMKTFNDIFTLVNAGLGIINPALATIGTKISAAGSIVQNFLDETADANILEVRIPNVVYKSRQFFNNWVDMKKEFQKLAIDENLSLLTKRKEELIKRGQNVEPLANVERSFAELRNLVENKRTPDSDVIQTLNDKIEQEESLWKKVYGKKHLLVQESLKVLNHLKTYTKVKQLLGDLGTKCEDLKNPDRINGIRDQVERAYQKTRQLRSFKEEILFKMIPLLEKIRNTSNVNGTCSSVGYLDFKKFEMKDYFEKVLEQIEYFAKDFGLASNFEKTLKRMKEVVDMILSTYIRIEEYVETMKKADYEKELYLAPFDVTYVKDAKLSMALAKMVQTSFANIVLDDYFKWMTSFKQYIFPFADELMGIFESSIPEVDDLLTRAQDAAERLEFYGSKMNKRRAELKEFENTVTTKFGYSLPPFHIWNSSHFASNISAIFSGKRMKLVANISEHRNLNAVKFSDIWLRFATADPEVGKKLKQDLQGYALLLKHNGDSYYRCDERVFLISSESHLMERVYNDEKQEKFDKNFDVKMSNSDFILSPYASWTIEIVNRGATGNFDSFKKYKGQVNMELVGLGQYTDKNVSVCSSDLKKYYENEL